MADSGPVTVALWDLQIPGGKPTAESILLQPSGFEAEALFSTDNREPVPAADFAPGGKYRSIVKIFIRYERQAPDDERWAIGTGWLVRPDLFVTAGHCAFDWREHLGKASSIKAHIGYSGTDSINSPNVQNRLGKCVATTHGWFEGPQNRHNDVAFVQVDTPFTDVKPFAFMDTPLAGSDVLSVVGYPGDKSKNKELGAEMYEGFMKVAWDLSKSNTHLLDYKISTYAGQSGSPLLRKGTNFAIGAHVYGGMSLNSASPINTAWGNPYAAYISAIDKRASNLDHKGRVDLFRADGLNPVDSPAPKPISSDRTEPVSVEKRYSTAVEVPKPVLNGRTEPIRIDERSSEASRIPEPVLNSRTEAVREATEVREPVLNGRTEPVKIEERSSGVTETSKPVLNGRTESARTEERSSGATETSKQVINGLTEPVSIDERSSRLIEVSKPVISSRMEPVRLEEKPAQAMTLPTANEEVPMDPEGFLDVLRSVAKTALPIAGGVLQTGSMFLGPIGGPLSAVVGTALGVAGKVAESAMVSGPGAESGLTVTGTHNSGHAERAILAEAALQAVLYMDEDKAKEIGIVEYMRKSYMATAPLVQKVFPHLIPAVIGPAFRIAVDRVQKESNGEAECGFARARRVIQRPTDLHEATFNFDRKTLEFAEALMEPGYPVIGEESFFSNLGSVISKGFSVARPLISTAASGLSQLNSVLPESSMGPSPAEVQMHLLCDRAVMGEAALRALIQQPRNVMEEEGFFDTLRGVIQNVGPKVLAVAPNVVESVKPIVSAILAPPGNQMRSGTTSGTPQMATGAPHVIRTGSQPGLGMPVLKSKRSLGESLLGQKARSLAGSTNFQDPVSSLGHPENRAVTMGQTSNTKIVDNNRDGIMWVRPERKIRG